MKQWLHRCFAMVADRFTGEARADIKTVLQRLDAIDDGIERLRSQPPATAPEATEVARLLLKQIAENRLAIGPALLAAMKDIRIAAQLHCAASSAEWLHANADRVPLYERRPELLEAILPMIPPEGDLAEFGVFKGAVTWFVRPRFPTRTYHAFDSWKGVPEAMSLSVSKYSFDLGGTVPDLPANTTIHAGWFDETIPRWRETCPCTLAFAYIDCDLYESVRTVLEGIADRVSDGSILLFDDWFNFPNWEAHSRRAADEWTARYDKILEPLGATVLEHSAAFRIVR